MDADSPARPILPPSAAPPPSPPGVRLPAQRTAAEANGFAASPHPESRTPATLPAEPSSAADSERAAARPAFDAPPQFRLSTLLWGVAGAAVVLAVARQMGGWALVGAGWFGAMIAAHLAATACGHRVYGRLPNRRRPWRSSAANFDADGNPSFHSSPPRLPTLFEEHRLRFAKLSLGASIVGAALGVGLGCGLALSQPWTSRSFNGLVVTALSLGVLGGVLGWGLSCLLRVFLSSWEPRGEQP